MEAYKYFYKFRFFGSSIELILGLKLILVILEALHSLTSPRKMYFAKIQYFDLPAAYNLFFFSRLNFLNKKKYTKPRKLNIREYSVKPMHGGLFTLQCESTQSS